MGVYIPNWDKPKSCDECWAEYAYEICNSHSGTCPLVSVPPHGDLIDRTNLLMIINQIKGQAEFPERFVLDVVERAIKSRRAVIPAEPCKEKGE